MTLEELMLSKGFSQQEITDLGPMLSSPKFRATMEAELNEGVKAKKDLDEYDRWFTQEITPEHQKLLSRVADAEADAAAAKARFEAYQKSGMRKQAGGDPAADTAAADEAARKAREAAERGGVDLSKYITNDKMQDFAEAQGKAIATATNIISQHMQLYPGNFIDMEQLQQEARNAKKPVKDYWESKYNVAAKRAELAQKVKDDERAAIAKEERQKVLAELGTSNPNMSTGLPSPNPFVIRKQKTEGKQPWEVSPNDLNRSRIEGAIKKAASRGELTTA